MTYDWTSADRAIERAYTSAEFSPPISLADLCKLSRAKVRPLDAEPFCLLERRIAVIDASADHFTQREQASHELAHILLHHVSELLVPDAFTELQEREANSLQLRLLIPTHQLLPYLDDERPPTIERAIYAIAERFDVSVPFARRRYAQFAARCRPDDADDPRLVREREPWGC